MSTGIVFCTSSTNGRPFNPLPTLKKWRKLEKLSISTALIFHQEHNKRIRPLFRHMKRQSGHFISSQYPIISHGSIDMRTICKGNTKNFIFNMPFVALNNLIHNAQNYKLMDYEIEYSNTCRLRFLHANLLLSLTKDSDMLRLLQIKKIARYIHKHHNINTPVIVVGIIPFQARKSIIKTFQNANIPQQYKLLIQKVGTDNNQYAHFCLYSTHASVSDTRSLYDANACYFYVSCPLESSETNCTRFKMNPSHIISSPTDQDDSTISESTCSTSTAKQYQSCHVSSDTPNNCMNVANTCSSATEYDYYTKSHSKRTKHKKHRFRPIAKEYHKHKHIHNNHITTYNQQLKNPKVSNMVFLGADNKPSWKFDISPNGDNFRLMKANIIGDEPETWRVINEWAGCDSEENPSV